MANLGFVFDATQVEPIEPNTEFEVIPAGKYHVQIVNSEMRDTESGNGEFLWMELAIMDGPHAYRRLFDALSAADIGREKLAAICRVTGQMPVPDSEHLHNRSMIANVKVQHGPGMIGPWNIVAQYLPYIAIVAE